MVCSHVLYVSGKAAQLVLGTEVKQVAVLQGKLVAGPAISGLRHLFGAIHFTCSNRYITQAFVQACAYKCRNLAVKTQLTFNIVF